MHQDQKKIQLYDDLVSAYIKDNEEFNNIDVRVYSFYNEALSDNKALIENNTEPQDWNVTENKSLCMIIHEGSHYVTVGIKKTQERYDVIFHDSNSSLFLENSKFHQQYNGEHELSAQELALLDEALFNNDSKSLTGESSLALFKTLTPQVDLIKERSQQKTDKIKQYIAGELGVRVEDLVVNDISKAYQGTNKCLDCSLLFAANAVNWGKTYNYPDSDRQNQMREELFSPLLSSPSSASEVGAPDPVATQVPATAQALSTDQATNLPPSAAATQATASSAAATLTVTQGPAATQATASSAAPSPSSSPSPAPASAVGASAPSSAPPTTLPLSPSSAPSSAPPSSRTYEVVSQECKHFNFGSFVDDEKVTEFIDLVNEAERLYKQENNSEAVADQALAAKQADLKAKQVELQAKQEGFESLFRYSNQSADSAPPPASSQAEHATIKNLQNDFIQFLHNRELSSQGKESAEVKFLEQACVTLGEFKDDFSSLESTLSLLLSEAAVPSADAKLQPLTQCENNLDKVITDLQSVFYDISITSEHTPDQKVGGLLNQIIASPDYGIAAVKKIKKLHALVSKDRTTFDAFDQEAKDFKHGERLLLQDKELHLKFLPAKSFFGFGGWSNKEAIKSYLESLLKNIKPLYEDRIRGIQNVKSKASELKQLCGKLQVVLQLYNSCRSELINLSQEFKGLYVTLIDSRVSSAAATQVPAPDLSPATVVTPAQVVTPSPAQATEGVTPSPTQGPAATQATASSAAQDTFDWVDVLFEGFSSKKINVYANKSGSYRMLDFLEVLGIVPENINESRYYTYNAEGVFIQGLNFIRKIANLASITNVPIIDVTKKDNQYSFAAYGLIALLSILSAVLFPAVLSAGGLYFAIAVLSVIMITGVLINKYKNTNKQGKGWISSLLAPFKYLASFIVFALYLAAIICAKVVVFALNISVYLLASIVSPFMISYYKKLEVFSKNKAKGLLDVKNDFSYVLHALVILASIALLVVLIFIPSALALLGGASVVGGVFGALFYLSLVAYINFKEDKSTLNCMLVILTGLVLSAGLYVAGIATLAASIIIASVVVFCGLAVLIKNNWSKLTSALQKIEKPFTLSTFILSVLGAALLFVFGLYIGGIVAAVACVIVTGIVYLKENNYRGDQSSAQGVEKVGGTPDPDATQTLGQDAASAVDLSSPPAAAQTLGQDAASAVDLFSPPAAQI